MRSALRLSDSEEQEKEIGRLAGVPSVTTEAEEVQAKTSLPAGYTINVKADWPKDWIAERRELFIEDMSAKSWHFSFSPAKVTSSTETDGHGSRVRNVARCDVCRRVVNPDWPALRLHAYKHLFLNIPFDAVECPCPLPLK